jgi:hypothetical protein
VTLAQIDNAIEKSGVIGHVDVRIGRAEFIAFVEAQFAMRQFSPLAGELCGPDVLRIRDYRRGVYVDVVADDSLGLLDVRVEKSR